MPTDPKDLARAIASNAREVRLPLKTLKEVVKAVERGKTQG